jgi:hypothetical protein
MAAGAQEQAIQGTYTGHQVPLATLLKDMNYEQKYYRFCFARHLLIKDYERLIYISHFPLCSAQVFTSRPSLALTAVTWSVGPLTRTCESHTKNPTLAQYMMIRNTCHKFESLSLHFVCLVPRRQTSYLLS